MSLVDFLIDRYGFIYSDKIISSYFIFFYELVVKLLVYFNKWDITEI